MSFHDLYPELRNHIYRHYFSVDGGYHYHHDSGRLTLADGGLIDLALMYTCRQISQEIRQLPFHFNPITFSTGGPASTQHYAKKIYFMLYEIGLFKKCAFDHISHLLTPEIYNTVALEYPGFTRIMDQLSTPRNHRGFRYVWDSGEAHSMCDAASRLLLANMVKVHGQDPVTTAIRDAWKADGMALSYPSNPSSPLKTLLVDYRCWDFPSEEIMATLRNASEGIGQYEGRALTENRLRSRPDYVATKKFRYSATSAAIHFLKRLPESVRLSLKKLVLNEDQPSIAMPSRHALGLIPFCKENRLLKVERRVSLFGCLLCSRGRHHDEPLGVHLFPRILATWLAEALALGPAGMPPGSFDLVLDGDPVPDIATDVFEALVLRDAAMQVALGEACSRGILNHPATFLQRAQHPCYMMEDYPRAIEGLLDMENTSLRYNFPLHNSWDVERLIDEQKDWTSGQWGQRTFDTTSVKNRKLFILRYNRELIIPRDSYADYESAVCALVYRSYDFYARTPEDQIGN